MGVVDNFSECFSFSFPKKKRMPKRTVNFTVRMDCEGCERKVRNAVEDLEGVEYVDINRKQKRVTVTGYVDPEEVLEEIQSTGRRAEYWPFVPYNFVTFPYVRGAYDKEAPSGFVRNSPQAIGDPKSPEMKLMVAFSDENPNSCAVMQI